MKKLTFILVSLSFLGGSYLTSLDEKTVNWYWFVPIIVVGFVSAILFNRASNEEAKHGDLLQNNRQVLEQSLHNIVQNLHQLEQRKVEIPTYEMRFEIDKLFREDLIQFADARDSMKHLFGIQHFADIMSSFAAGERYINRVWSASTDGYIDEVLLYVGKALAQFEHAQQEFDKAVQEEA